jgi:hypothetical protein
MTNLTHKSAVYSVSARRARTPASEDGLKENPKHVRQK